MAASNTLRTLGARPLPVGRLRAAIERIDEAVAPPPEFVLADDAEGRQLLDIARRDRAHDLGIERRRLRGRIGNAAGHERAPGRARAWRF